MTVALTGNQITSLSGNFQLSNTNIVNGTTLIDLHRNKISSLSSSTSFNLLGTNKVQMIWYDNQIGTISSTFNLTATGPNGYVNLDMNNAGITQLSSSANFYLSSPYQVYLYLYNNKIADVASTFNLIATGSNGYVNLDLSSAGVTSLSSLATFNLASPYQITIYLCCNNIASVDSTFNLNATGPNGYIQVDLSRSQVAKLSSTAKFNLFAANGVDLYFYRNNFTSSIDSTFNLISNGPNGYVTLDFSNAGVTELSSKANINILSAYQIFIYLYGNAIANIASTFNLNANGPKGYIYFDLSNSGVAKISSTASFNIVATLEIDLFLQGNNITDVAGNFNLTATDPSAGFVYFDFSSSGIAKISSISSFNMFAPYKIRFLMYGNTIASIDSNFNLISNSPTGNVYFDLSKSGVASISPTTSFNIFAPNQINFYLCCNNLGTISNTFNLTANGIDGYIYLDMSGSGVTSLSSTANFLMSAQKKVDLYLNKNKITSVGSTFNLAGTNSSQGSVYLTLSNNQITSLASATFNLTAGSRGAQLRLTYNAITSVNGSAITFQSPYYSSLSLHHNAITSLSGNFNLNCSDPNGDAELYLYSNQLTTLSPATFYLNGRDNVWLDFSSNQLTSISAGTITLQSSTYIGLDLDTNQLTTVSLGTDTNPPLSDGQDIYLYNNNLTSINCNDLAINAGAAYNYIDISRNQITSVKCGANSPLNTSQQVYLDLSYNSLTAINSGDLNFNGLVNELTLKNQNAVLNSIAPGALPSKFFKIWFYHFPVKKLYAYALLLFSSVFL